MDFQDAVLDLKQLDGEFSVCKIADPTMVDFRDEFVFLSKTDRDFSLVCRPRNIPQNAINIENGWKALKIEGKQTLSLAGILAGITEVLAKKKIGIFPVSTFDNDYVLVKSDQARTALRALREAAMAAE